MEFYSKNKFEKLVHLVGFITRIYHDTWSPERQNILFLVSEIGPGAAFCPLVLHCKADVVVKKKVLICRSNQNLLNSIALYSVIDRICNRFIYSRPTQRSVITVILLPSP